MTIEIRTKIRESLSGFEGEWVDLPMLVPSDIVLETAGENLRPRLYFAHAPNGNEYCLRADLTIPAALKYLSNGIDGTYLCEGKVFRESQVTGDIEAEVTQIGLEIFGNNDAQAADIKVFNICAEIAGNFESKLSAVISDGGLIPKFISLLNIPNVWKIYLKQNLDSQNAFLKALKIASRQKIGLNPEEEELFKKGAVGSYDYVMQTLVNQDYQTFHRRTPEEIAARFYQKLLRKNSDGIDEKTVELIKKFINIKDEPNKAFAEILEISGELNIDFAEYIEALKSRLNELKIKDIIFKTTKSSRFDYYDGFAFDIFGASIDPIASGGRYDNLIGKISKNEKSAMAIGAVIRPERIGAQND